MTRITPLALATLLVACGESSDPPPPGGDPRAGGDSTGTGDWDPTAWDFSGNNNGVLIDGASFPGGSDTPSTLHHIVPTTESLENTAFTLGDTTIARPKTVDSMAFYVLIPITNVGARPYCWLEVSLLELLDAGENVVASEGGKFVYGSVARSGTVFTSTCLVPGEIGYYIDTVLDIGGDLYDQVDSASVELVVDAGEDLHDPAAALVASSYTWDGSTLTLPFDNQGNTAATLLNAMSFFILFDDADTPLYYHFLRTPGEVDLTVAASGSSALTDPYITYQGDGSKLRLFFDWTE